MKIYLVKSINEEATQDDYALNLRVFAEEKDAKKYAASIEKQIKREDREANFCLIEEFDIY